MPFFEDLIQNLFKGIVYGGLLKSGLVILNYTQKDYKGKLQILKNLEQKLSDECTKLFKKDVEATFIALEEEKIIFEFKGLDKNSKNFTSFLEGLRQYLCLTLSSEEIMLIAQ